MALIGEIYLLQSLFKPRIPLVHGEISDSQAQGFGAADEDTDTFGPADAGINEVSLQHHIVGHQDGNNNYREL